MGCEDCTALTPFSPSCRTSRMALVSEFLGQLCLNAAVIPIIFSHSHRILFILRNQQLSTFNSLPILSPLTPNTQRWWRPWTSTQTRTPLESRPPSKPKASCVATTLGLKSLDVALLPADEKLVFVSQRLGSGGLGRAGKASNVCVGKAEFWPLTGSYWQQSDR